MPSPFSLGAQNADNAFSTFIDGDVTFFSVAMTTAQTQSDVAHGLSAAPDFVIVGNGNASVAGDQETGWSATATTLTVIALDTAASNTVSVFAANLS
jgi:hypothetical protein